MRATSRRAFPALLLASLASLGAAQEEDEFAALERQDLRAGGEESMRFLLSRFAESQPPRAGYKLALVLPGGDGSAEFQAFVQRIHLNALSEEYLVAQLVAPVWSEDQAESLVWPTEKNPWPKMEFSTEEFLDAVVADVEERHPLDLAHVFVLAWSSGGPAAYAYSLHEGSRATGTFVAMSVYKPDQMASTKKAKGHAYFLLHSPEDRIPIRFAEQARDELTKHGAKVELLTYEGGHGWRGDVYGNLRRGFRFLEEEHGKPGKAKKR